MNFDWPFEKLEGEGECHIDESLGCGITVILAKDQLYEIWFDNEDVAERSASGFIFPNKDSWRYKLEQDDRLFWAPTPGSALEKLFARFIKEILP